MDTWMAPQLMLICEPNSIVLDAYKNPPPPLWPQSSDEIFICHISIYNNNHHTAKAKVPEMEGDLA